MIVAVIPMGVVQSSIHQIIGVISVRYAFMATAWAMLVACIASAECTAQGWPRSPRLRARQHDPDACGANDRHVDNRRDRHAGRPYAHNWGHVDGYGSDGASRCRWSSFRSFSVLCLPPWNSIATIRQRRRQKTTAISNPAASATDICFLAVALQLGRQAARRAVAGCRRKTPGHQLSRRRVQTRVRD
jgi:hypothetical protein